MEQEHSFATKGVVRPVWSPSEAAVEREARRRSHYYTYVNFWPFASVMLALLFLLIGDPAPDVHLPPPVDLPAGFHTTAQTKALADDAMRVYVTRDGRVFFGDLQVVPEDLPEVVRRAIQGGAEKKVYLAVDARAKYGDAAAVAGEIGKAGIREICILAYTPEK